MGSLLDRFEEHDGAVRSVDFHRTQPLFVSGGDDYKIKVWNHKTRKCLFTLSGHLDYVRTVCFHHEYPWILSCSDDQTIRIWNWQSRNCIALISGHSHYVMCAAFHPKDDLIVSASLDQTVRVWDISGLRKKNAAPQSMTFEEQLQRSQAAQSADLFGNTDCIVKYVLEGHDRGVNWVAFHPTMPLIISAGDDRNVKLWRMSETKAWEVDTCRGHFSNVSSALFHPRQELMMSVGEDKTIRVWDLNKRTAVQSFRRESDRFWIITAHPEMNLFAAGHDNGVMVFKLERERPAYTIDKGVVYFVNKEKYVKSYDTQRQVEGPSLLSLRKLGSQWQQPRTISYNPAERAVLVTSVRDIPDFLKGKAYIDQATDNGIYELVSLPRDGSTLENNDARRGSGNSAVFIARNRFAVLDKSKQNIDVKDLSNATTKSFKPPVNTNEIFYGGSGNLLLATSNSVVLYDIQQKQILAQLTTPAIKYVFWSNDGNHVALLGKHAVTIATKTLEQVCSIHETIRLKSACWDDTGVLLYSTLNHIKYTLMNGDNGIIKTLEQTLYLIRVKGRQVMCLDREAKPRTVDIDPTEYRFKLALVKRNYDEMFSIIKNSNLVGQSVISYVQKKGYPEIALQFVQDPQTRFELAIECGDLAIAIKEAKDLEKPEIWKKLSVEALRQGNHSTVEMAYQKLKSFDKLSFLYLTIGDRGKLEKMNNIAISRGDYMSQFQTSLYLGECESRIQMLKETGMYPLAYITAKSNGRDDLAEEILAEAGLTESDIKLPSHTASTFNPPQSLSSATKSNWPLKEVEESNIEAVLAAQAVEDYSANGNKEVDDLTNGVDLLDIEEDEHDDGGWDIDEIPVEEQEEEEVFTDAQEGGNSETDTWVRTSPLAADHVAAGSFETAMQLLNRQVGAVNFEPLKPRFLAILQASRTYLPANAGLPAISNFVRRNPEQNDIKKSQPILPRTVEELFTVELAEGYKLVRGNKLSEAVEQFRSILYALLLTAVSKQDQATKAEQMVETCHQYILGCSIELKRRELYPSQTDLTPDQHKNNLELAAYFTNANLQPPHRYLALQNAMRLSSIAKNHITAAAFAQKLLSLNPNGKAADQARKVIAASERSGSNAIELDYDQFTDFDVCLITCTPIYAGSEKTQCPFCKARYQPSNKGRLCLVCQVSAIGAASTGRKIIL